MHITFYPQARWACSMAQQKADVALYNKSIQLGGSTDLIVSQYLVFIEVYSIFMSLLQLHNFFLGRQAGHCRLLRSALVESMGVGSWILKGRTRARSSSLF